MTRTERREAIIRLLQESVIPIPGMLLATQLNVSRQIIVQDVALLRAAGHEIISTSKGYVISASPAVSRVFKVWHTNERLEEELRAVVDLGGCVDNVIVHHKIYGELEAELNITSRWRVQEFIDGIKSGKSAPLNNITSGYHYHKISADTDATLDRIEAKLKELGFLVKKRY